MADEIGKLREQVQLQQALIEQQAGVVERLEERLAAVEHEASGGGPLGADSRWSAGDGTTDRRHLLSRAATAAVGAVVGGTALAVGQAPPAAAAAGSFDGNPAVTALANPTSGQGLHAESQTGDALYAGSISGRALVAFIGGGTGTHLFLVGGSQVPPPTSAAYRYPGSIVLDGANDLWLCIGAGAPGAWRRLSGPNTAGALTLLTSPVRIYDSRPSNPPDTGPKTPLANGASRTLDCTNNASGVPVGATGVLANITVVNTSASGYLAAFRTGTSVPVASTINWFTAGEVVANTTVVACDATAHIDCYVPPSSSTNFFVDVIGYYR